MPSDFWRVGKSRLFKLNPEAQRWHYSKFNESGAEKGNSDWNGCRGVGTLGIAGDCEVLR